MSHFDNRLLYAPRDFNGTIPAIGTYPNPHYRETPTLVSYLEYRLLYPPRRVRAELEAALGVKLFHCPNQPEGALLNEVRQRHAVVLVLSSDRDYHAHISAYHRLLR